MAILDFFTGRAAAEAKKELAQAKKEAAETVRKAEEDAARRIE